MLDYRHQGKGYGKAALLLVIEEFKNMGTQEIYTSFVSTNEGVVFS